jgi:hypothetical protein
MRLQSSNSLAASRFISALGSLPVLDWLAIRDAMYARDHGPVFAAYRAASAAAAERALAADAKALADDVRRLTDAIGWAAEFRPDDEAITRRDVGAMQLLAEWAGVGLLVREGLSEETFAALYGPFAAAIPLVMLRGCADQ